MDAKENQALIWWSRLSFEVKFYEVIFWLKTKGLNTTDVHPNDVTESDIQEIWNLRHS